MALTEERKRYLASWREKNRERLREYHLQWSREHGIREGQSWREDVYGTPEQRAERRRATQKAWREANPEKYQAKQERYRERHPGIRAEQTKAWRESNKGRTWIEAYRPQQRENWSRWYWSDLERGRMQKRMMSMRRRARKLSAGGVASTEQVLARVAYYGGKCWVCGDTWEHIDHVIPLAKGGSDWPANLRPICSFCNLSKHTKSPKEVSRRTVSVANNH